MRAARLAALALAAGCASSRPAPTRAPPPAPEVKSLAAPLPAPSVGAPKLGGKLVSVPSANTPLVVIRIAFQAGSIDDPKGKEGLTALTARMLAEGGTEDLTSAQLLEALFPMAASIDVQTDKELTVFSGTIHVDHVQRYLPLLVAALTRPRWDPKELTRMREDALQEIVNGLRTGNDEALGKAALDLVMWQGHPYAHFVGGTVEGLKAIALDDAKAQAARVFTRDRMLIGVGGAADERVAQLLTGLDALKDTGAPLVDLPAPALAEPRVLLVQKESASTAISMGYPYALGRGDPDFYPMMVAVSALGEHRQFHGRLMRELRIKRGLNYGDYAYPEHFAQEGGTSFALLNIARRQQAFTLWLRPVVAANELFALRAARYELERACEGGLSPEEFEITRGFLAGYSLLWEQTPMRRLGYAMDDLFYGTKNHLEGFRLSLETMKVEDVNRVLARWIKPWELRIAVVTRDPSPLESAIVSDAPSPIHYVAEKPDAEVLSEDRKIVGLPLGLAPAQIAAQPASQLFER